MQVTRFLVLALSAGIIGLGTDASARATDEEMFKRVTDKARSLAAETYSTPEGGLPDALKTLSYQQYREIRFNKEHAIWKDHSLFNVELFHLGFLYHEPVVVNEVVGENVITVRYDTAMFDYGKNADLEQSLEPDLGFAGFRVHFPINRKDYNDEVIAFLGASYFRMVGAGQQYGISARGLAINTALASGEEFPRFKEFWLVRPGPSATSFTFYALLESESVTGAYCFILNPGPDTSLEVEARLFARRDVEKLGVAPLTSMYLHGENKVRFYDDFRPEVHDSDGLLTHTREDEWIWRPLTNGKDLQVSSLIDENPRGFGLVQRDRHFDHYLDVEAGYHKRPSYWVTPKASDWGKGAVQLVEIPSQEETNDNIAAFWVPDEQLKAGQERVFKYRIEVFGAGREAHKPAVVERTRIGWGAIPGSDRKPPKSVRQFVVDFSGGELKDLQKSQPVEAELSTSQGVVKDITVTRLPADHGWRVAFKLHPREGQPADMRLYLTLRDRRLSETWNYVWHPVMMQ